MNQKLVMFYNYQISKLKKLYPIIKCQIFNSDEICIIVHEYFINKITLFLKLNMLYQFKILTCITCVDYPKNKHRFKLIYEFLSLKHNIRLKIKIFTNELIPVNSITDHFFAAKWQEAEIWDMFGIFFNKHPNLIRLLTDYGFDGFPARKDFPLTGFVEFRYNELKKTVISEFIELNQEFRNFKYLSVWENQKEEDFEESKNMF
jgi:NADH:ubiquinone oxidoreductase subunit C